MIRKKTDYRVDATIRRDLPKIRIEIAYMDNFSDDHYVLDSMTNEVDGTQKIPFQISKNGYKIGNVTMSDRNFDKFFFDVFEIIDDADFRSEFNSSIAPSLSKELERFFEMYDNAIVMNGITMEGERRRMRVLSGIIR